MYRILLICIFAALPVLAHESGFPEKTLKTIFPEATGFTMRKKLLKPEQTRKAEQDSGSKLQRNDNPFSFYVALGKSTTVLGSVLMIDTHGTKGAIDLALGVNKDGTIRRLLLTANKDEGTLGSAAFLDQLKGKNIQSPLKVGQDIKYSGDAKSAQALLNAVRRGLFLLAAAQGQ